MQIAPATLPAATAPIGISGFGTMRIGHALNGIRYTEHQLLAPVAAPLATFTGSLQDAIVGATALAAKLDASGHGRSTIALLAVANQWTAHTVFPDPMIIRAIDTGAGHGSIASISFPTIVSNFGALVTAQGSLIPANMR